MNTKSVKQTWSFDSDMRAGEPDGITFCRLPAFTVKSAVEDGFVRVLPTDKTGLRIGGIEAWPEHVCRADDRVDLSKPIASDGTEDAGLKQFLVEHACAFCAIHGVRAAEIVGSNRAWDLHRPSHREAMDAGASPYDVLGRADGRVWSAPETILVEVRRVRLTDEVICISPTQTREFVGTHGTRIQIAPPTASEDVTVTCSVHKIEISVKLSADEGILDLEHRANLLQSQSVAVVQDWTDESVWHALADVLGDLFALGALWANVRVWLAPYYHEATIGLVKSVWKDAGPGLLKES